MNNFLKFGLIGAALYWLFKDQIQLGSETTSTTQPAQQPDPAATSQASTQTPAKSQDELDAIEYAAALGTVQEFTKTGYTTQQLGQIEQWFYNERDLYKIRNGNLNHFTGHIVVELPKYAENVKKASPSEEALRSAALDPSKASLTGSYTLSGHQWNWYRAQAAIAAGIFVQAIHQPAINGLDPRMTAAEYHALLKQEAGLSGLRWR